MRQRRGHFAVLIALFLLGFGAFAQPDDAQGVLSRIPEPLTCGRPIAMEVETETFVHYPQEDGSVDSRHMRSTLSYMRDGQQAHCRLSSAFFDQNGAEMPDWSFVQTRLVTEEFVVHAERYGEDRYFGTVNEDAEVMRESLAANAEINVLSGLVSTTLSIPMLLGKAVEIRKGMEEIDGVPCFVLESSSEEGEVRAWVAPDKGYNFLKYTVRRTGDHKLRGEFLRDHNIIDWTFTVDEIKIDKIGEEYVPLAGKSTRTATYTDGRKDEVRESIECTKIDFSPDFKSIGAFELDLPSGTVLSDANSGVKYEVRAGRIAPHIDNSDLAALEEGISMLNARNPLNNQQDRAQVLSGQGGSVSQEAQPKSGDYGRWVMVVCGFVVALSAFALILKRKLRHTHTSR
jgi:hypothetical protein